jgi:hypothetical protein
MKITPMQSIIKQSVLSNKLLLKYLNQYPNLGQNGFKVYSRLHGYVERKEHLTEIGLSHKKLCNQLIKHSNKVT